MKELLSTKPILAWLHLYVVHTCIAEAHWPYGCTLKWCCFMTSFHKLNVLNVKQALYFNIFVDNSFLWSFFFLDTTLIFLFWFVCLFFFFQEFFYLSFSSNDVVNTGTPLHKGDKVEFYVTTDKRYTIWGDVCTVIASARRLRKA